LPPLPPPVAVTVVALAITESKPLPALEEFTTPATPPAPTVIVVVSLKTNDELESKPPAPPPAPRPLPPPPPPATRRYSTVAGTDVIINDTPDPIVTPEVINIYILRKL
jgi:hypothetical protein